VKENQSGGEGKSLRIEGDEKGLGKSGGQKYKGEESKKVKAFKKPEGQRTAPSRGSGRGDTRAVVIDRGYLPLTNPNLR